MRRKQWTAASNYDPIGLELTIIRVVRGRWNIRCTSWRLNVAVDKGMMGERPTPFHAFRAALTPPWGIERRWDAFLSLNIGRFLPFAARTIIFRREKDPLKARADILNSWKEVAGYLGRGVRTVQRWEKDLGLPVRRPRNKTRSAVMAITSEIDSWLSARGMTNVETVQLVAIQNDDERLFFLQRRLGELQAESARIREELKRLAQKRGNKRSNAS